MSTKPQNKLVQQGLLKWIIPPIRTEITKLEPLKRDVVMEVDKQFQAVNKAVIDAKAFFDHIAPQEFDIVMKAVDLYAGLKRRTRTEFGMMISTNASLKMYEMIIQMKLISCSTGAVHKLRAFCNAELPGAFIVAINHYVKTMCPETNFDWLGSSYYPDADMSGEALGDQYKIYAGNREHWLMGPRPNAMPSEAPTVTGDVTDASVVAALSAAVHSRFKDGATLYTSDAGIDVSSDYSKQEELTALLNFGQVLCGILSLAPGGHLVTKQYTFFTSFSRSIVALLATLFDELYVVKPRTSRPVNSEIYLVGKGFRGIASELADALLERIAKYRATPDSTPCDWGPLIAPELMTDVDSALLRIARQLYGRQQVAFLNEAAELYKQGIDKIGKRYVRDAFIAQDQWLLENTMRRIRVESQLVTGGDEKPRILVKNKLSGLRIDYMVVQEVLPEVGQFHLEHFIEDGYDPEVPNYLFVNQEFLFDWDIAALTSNKATALCKTHYAEQVLSSIGITGIYTGFTTPDIFDATIVRDPKLVVHLAGLSWLKGTMEILRGWFEHGGIDLDATLFITRQYTTHGAPADDLAYWDALKPEKATFNGIKVERKNNVYLTKNRLTDSEFRMMANMGQIHLCPSITEGWGHIINTGRSVGAIVITTDAAPMNELIDESSGILVPTSKDVKTIYDLNPTQRKYYTPEIAKLPTAAVDEQALIAAVAKALSSPVAQTARQRYLEGAAQFAERMRALSQ
jgi:cap2 methyltransferase